jgi:hypothetical protein
MTKTRTPRGKRQELRELPQAVTVQMPLPMMATLNEVRQGFHSLCIEAGRQVLSAMMEHDRTALCGPKWMPNPVSIFSTMGPLSFRSMPPKFRSLTRGRLH